MYHYDVKQLPNEPVHTCTYTHVHVHVHMYSGSGSDLALLVTKKLCY